MEYFGGQGLYWVLFDLGRANQWFQYNGLKVFLGFFVMWVGILLFILIYYLNSLLFRALTLKMSMRYLLPLSVYL